ncbi:hypothetical protein [Streptomyces sp. NPDC001843]|uniref:hypothetical protein n=1 Tax=Streptomyces sp. NPDC001843 TaxID=3364617 RepID=UPI0036CE54AB
MTELNKINDRAGMVEKTILTPLNRALEHAAEARAKRFSLDAESELQIMRERLLGFGATKADAVQMGTDCGNMSWPYESPYGTVPWRTVADDHEKCAITDFYGTPYGVLWVNSQ